MKNSNKKNVSIVQCEQIRVINQRFSRGILASLFALSILHFAACSDVGERTDNPQYADYIAHQDDSSSSEIDEEKDSSSSTENKASSSSDEQSSSSNGSECTLKNDGEFNEKKKQVCETDGWRKATELEITLSEGCTEGKDSSTAQKDNRYICDNGSWRLPKKEENEEGFVYCLKKHLGEPMVSENHPTATADDEIKKMDNTFICTDSGWVQKYITTFGPCG
ncbi:MAG: hypothetical protein HUK20_14180, partial [Fibrobacter sp.]|nr:hypothetical protein [Fibrobacter sp.]